MIPDPADNRDANPLGGAGGPARDDPYASSRAAGHIACAICTDTIALDDYRSARCWTDPTGTTVAAHAACLVRVGEADLKLHL